MPASILAKVASGYPEAFDECLARYGGLVWSLARRALPNRDDAEDAVQEIFVDVWRKAARFDGEIASEATFVAMIARRRLIDRQRKQQRSINTVSISAEVERPVEVDQGTLEFGEQVAQARQQMQLLRGEERQVLELVIDKGLSQAQVAAKLQIPLGTVKTHARRGLIRLRQLLDAQPRAGVVEEAL